ncbi:MAG: hypothetical protein ACRYG2_25965 [Janthinobacterium lividum]
MPVTTGPEVLAVEPRAVDRRLLVVLGVGVLVAALVLGGLAAIDRFRGGASSPTTLAERVLAAVDHEDVAALARLVEPGERAALVRLLGSWSGRLDDLGLPVPVGGGPRVPTSDALAGLTLDVTGATPTVGARSGDLAVVDLGDVAVRVRTDPDTARGLLRTWFAYRHLSGPQDLTYPAANLPQVGALPRLVSVERSGRWYLSVLGTLLGPDVANGSLPRVEALAAPGSATPQAAVEGTLRLLLDARTRTDATPLAGTLDASGSDVLQLWASEVATTGLDRSPDPITALRTSSGPVAGTRAVVRVETLELGDGTSLRLDGRCLTAIGDSGCLHPSGYRYAGGLGSLSAFELLGHDEAFSLTAVQGPDGWRTSVSESLVDALVGYADGLTREQVLLVLNEEQLDPPSGVLQPDRGEDVAFTSAGYATRTVRVERAGLYRVVPGPDGTSRSTLYDPDGQPSIQPFFPNDSVYRLTPGDHTLLVWADDGFARTLDQAGTAPYVQRVEVRSVD